MAAGQRERGVQAKMVQEWPMPACPSPAGRPGSPLWNWNSLKKSPFEGKYLKEFPLEGEFLKEILFGIGFPSKRHSIALELRIATQLQDFSGMSSHRYLII